MILGRGAKKSLTVIALLVLIVLVLRSGGDWWSSISFRGSSKHEEDVVRLASDLKQNDIDEQQGHGAGVQIKNAPRQKESGGQRRDAPLPSKLRVPMRMTLNSTKHAWPWGKDPYDTQSKCSEKQYDTERLPSASVIICFHESEQLEHLLHTLHSLVQHTEPHLLHEIILIDDHSSQPLHGMPLSNYVESVFGGKVRVIRNNGPELLGVIKARLLGIRAAVAPVVVVLDAHMEMRERWLEPLVSEISREPRTLASITLDWMKPQKDGTWVYEHGPNDAMSAWFWYQFAFTLWAQDTPEEKKRKETDPTQPFLCPCTIGNWAMDRAFFHEIGGLDDGMLLWGGENIDLAIRTYLWGGRVINVPCSHGAHLEGTQRSYRGDWGEQIKGNYKRIAEVWMDEYKDTFYIYNPPIKLADAGNLTKALQDKARCPNKFDTFLKKGYPQLGVPLVDNFAHGSLGCAQVTGKALYWGDSWQYGLRTSTNGKHQEVAFLTTEGYLRTELAFFNVDKATDGKMTFTTHTAFVRTKPLTKWLHKQNGLLMSYDPPGCMRAATDSVTIDIVPCDPSDLYQQWNFASYTQHYRDLVAGTFQFKDADHKAKYKQLLGI